MPTINFASINKKIDDELKKGLKTRGIQSKLKKVGEEGAQLVSAALQSEFDSHKVTKSLQGSPSESDGLLRGYGNLASFFGLSEGKADRDLSILRKLFESSVVTVTKNASGSYSVRIRFNPLSVYYNKTPAQGYDGSWLKAMEEALIKSTFKFYLFKEEGIANSRSGTGIQARHSLKRGLQPPAAIPYIKEIYEKVLSKDGEARKILTDTFNRIFKK